MAAHVQGRFWEMHAALTDMDAFSEAGYLTAANDMGLDLARFREDLDPGNRQDFIREDMAEALALGLRGTPALFVNGVMVPGSDSERLERLCWRWFPI